MNENPSGARIARYLDDSVADLEPRVRALLQSTFLAHEAAERVHAIGVTLVRLVLTRRRLLEWETAAASADWGVQQMKIASSTLSNSRDGC